MLNDENYLTKIIKKIFFFIYIVGIYSTQLAAVGNLKLCKLNEINVGGWHKGGTLPTSNIKSNKLIKITNDSPSTYPNQLWDTPAHY